MSGLVEIFSLLPPEYQKKALVAALEQMFAEGQWPGLQDIVEQAEQMELDEIFWAVVLTIGIKAALRLREFDLAFGRYEILAQLREDEEIQLLQAEALYQLAIQLLPADAEKIYRLWQKVLQPWLPLPVQRILAKTGQLLGQEFARNGDSANLAALRGTLKEYLAERVYKSVAHRLNCHARYSD